MAQQAVALGLTGIGIADRNSVAGVVEAYAAVEQLNEKYHNLRDKELPQVKAQLDQKEQMASSAAYPA